MRTSVGIPIVLLCLAAGVGARAQQSAPPGPDCCAIPAGPNPKEVIGRVIDGAKEADRAQYLYERIERVESGKDSGDSAPQSVKISRVIPAERYKNTAWFGRKALDSDAYRSELDNLLKSLIWAAESGQPQREAYQKIQKR